MDPISIGNALEGDLDVATGTFLEDLSRTALVNENNTDNSIPSLVAVLPVTVPSLSYLNRTLLVLLDAPGSINEIVLLAPSEIHHELRRLLGQVFPEDTFDLPDVSITPWPNGLEEGVAVLHTARQILADRFLFMDTTGLNTVDAVTREMLVGAFATPLPVGPRGFNSSSGQFLCISGNKQPQASAFLVPPFSVSSLLVPPHEVEPSPIYDVWSSLGRHISRARFERVGGVVVAGNDSVARSWCSGSEPRPQLDEFLLRKSAVSVEDPLSSVSPAPGSEATCSQFGTLAIILSRVLDVYSFGSALCHMQSQEYVTNILVTEESVENQVYTKQIPLSQNCNIGITVLDPDQSDAIDDWLASLPCLPLVVLYSGIGSTVHQAQISASVHKYASTVFVHIPHAELQFCDWMGSLTVQEWLNWHVPRLDISIITNDRSHSLDRLLTSLQGALLFGDKVNLRINIEQTADPVTLEVVDKFSWAHGPVFIHRRVIHGGLLPAVVESWYPNSNDTYGLLLEDDVELSPLFYAWIKMSLLRYRYGDQKDVSPLLFGISLYQQKNLELRPEGRHRFNARSVFSSAGLPHPNTPFLSQIPCSWGAVYFPEHWRDFHEYLSIRLAGAHPSLPLHQVVAPGLRSNKWTHSWKKYFIELVFLRGHAMLYPNYRGYRSLSTNHLELGSHVKVVPADVYERKKRLFRLPLLALPPPAVEVEAGAAVDTGLLDLPMGRMPPWETLPVTDLFGLVTSLDTLKARGDRRRAELFGCEAPMGSVTPSMRALLCLDDDMEYLD